MDEVTKLKRYLALADGAFRDASLYVRLNEEEAILSEARIHLTRNEFQENGISIRRDLSHGIPGIRIDPDLVRGALLNIVINAVQAMPEGGQLMVKLEASSPEWVTVSFTDTGAGIPGKELAKVFEPLFTTKAKGIGLGLALTRTLVEGHGGTIEVQSEVGKGSTFTVKLPVG